MIQIIALLYATQKGIEGIREFESKVIPILKEHQGNLISASSNTNKSESEPDEIHVIQFPSVSNFDAYKNDPRIIKLASLKSKMVRKTELFITDNFHQY